MQHSAPSSGTPRLDRRESALAQRTRAQQILRLLRDDIPEATCALDHKNVFELLVAVILSAQCLDSRVNQVTPELFEVAPDPAAMLKLGTKKIERLIKSINFFKTKALHIFKSSQILVDEHQAQVPTSLEDLIDLPGVGRKTANVIRAVGFQIPGVVVDTHVRRIARRLEFTRHFKPELIEKDLEKVFDRQDWIDASHLIILHGRKTCFARSPACDRCVIRGYCPSRGLEADAWKEKRI